MKHKLLILTRNPVAKVGIASYLSSLFGQYLTIVSTRIADLTPEDMEDAGCILYTAGELKEQMPFSIPDSVKQLFLCGRKLESCALKFDHVDQFLKFVDKHGCVISVSGCVGDVDAEWHCKYPVMLCELTAGNNWKQHRGSALCVGGITSKV